jgi:hypothetical protein
MGFIAKDSGGGGDFKKVPPGVYVARCFSLIDMGTQISDGQYGAKEQHKIRIGFEVFGEDDQGVPLTINMDGKEMPLTISKTYTLSLHEKAGLRKDLAAWRSRDFTEEEAKGFDISKLLGVYCMLNVTTSENNGKTYTNIAGITPLPQALKNAKPEGVHNLIAFDLDNPDWDVFKHFHEKLQETIKQSPEFAQAISMAHMEDSEF